MDHLDPDTRCPKRPLNVIHLLAHPLQVFGDTVSGY